MNHIPDPIERGEASAERAYDEMIQPDGRMKCPCGALFDPDCEGGTISPDPYAMPVCPKCWDRAFAPQTNAARCQFTHWSDVELERIHSTPEPNPEDGEWVPAGLCAKMELERDYNQRNYNNAMDELRLKRRQLDEQRTLHHAAAEEIASVKEVLWPDQTGLPNEHRDAALAIKAIKDLTAKNAKTLRAKFKDLHTAWLAATHRQDMNEQMDALASFLGLDPTTMKIKTSHDCPPIPDRSFDWSAVTDNYDLGHPIGHGATEAEAIADLKQQIEDNSNE